MHILITGAAGMVGRKLTEQLVSDGGLNGKPIDKFTLVDVVAPNAPAGFTGDADVWRENSEGLGLWELNAWIWLHNSNGIFAFHNPRVP